MIYSCFVFCFFFFFFNDTATTEIYTLSLHDALPISRPERESAARAWRRSRPTCPAFRWKQSETRSEEHTSELQSRSDLVCRLLLEKKKKKQKKQAAYNYKIHRQQILRRYSPTRSTRR